MFSLSLHKLRRQARELERTCRIAWNMKRDILPAERATRLSEAARRLRLARSERDQQAIGDAIKEGNAIMELVQPRSSLDFLRAITDTLVVAFGVAMAFRAYCFQPFKIPTGSMQPTFFGIHSEHTPDGRSGRPAVLDNCTPLKWATWLATGRWHIDIVARTGGEIRVFEDRAGAPGYVVVDVGHARYKVPRDAYDRGELDIPNQVRNPGLADDGGRQVIRLATGKAKLGQRIWSGDVISGDQVFVNRFAWYFRPPRVGDTMVFTTDGIPGLEGGQHYIKRLCGLPGQTISFDPPYLTIDGNRALEPESVLRKAEQRPSATRGYSFPPYDFTHLRQFGNPQTHYRTALQSALAEPGDSLTLGETQFLALGDNSPNSYDGRYWGPVPRRNLVGPASCVYWPFSCRWGKVK